NDSYENQKVTEIAGKHPESVKSESKSTTKFGKGNPGKPKGAVNKNTREIKEMILGALSRVGGEDYLARQAELNPVAFMGLVGKVLPMQVHGTGAGGALVVKFVKSDEEL